MPDGKDWFGCHLPEPVTGNLTDSKLCGQWSPVAFKKLKLYKCEPVLSVTKSRLQLWDSKCAYRLSYLYVHDKSANAGTTLFGGFEVDHSKTPHLNQGAAYETSDWLKPCFARHAKLHNSPS